MIKKSFALALMMLVTVVFLNNRVEGQERTVIDETGRKVKISSSPKRIISLAPGITEILFALHLDEEIIGVTDYCDFPVAARNKPRIGGFINPSIEKIVSLRPDLIIGTSDGNLMETIHRLGDLGFSVYLINPKSFNGVMKAIHHIGTTAGREEESRKITGNMILKEEEIATRIKSFPKPKIFFQVGYAPIMTAGRGTLADDLIRLAGGRSISENESVNYPHYNIETILSKAPDIIIMSSMDSKKDYLNLIKMWQSWKDLPAVKMNAVFVVDSNLVDRPTPRVAEGLEAMARMIHPEAFGKKK